MEVIMQRNDNIKNEVTKENSTGFIPLDDRTCTIENNLELMI